MDGSTVLYIIAVIIYFIYTSFAKKKPGEEGAERDGNADAPNQGPSFEELLREIRKDQSQPVSNEDTEGWTEEVSEREYSEEAEMAEEERYVEKKVAKPREGTYTGAYRNVKQPLVKLDDQVDLDDDKKILGEVVDVAGEHQVGNKYAKLLKDPETIKDAVILTEIFNRKHF